MRVLVFRFSALGDVALCIPVLQKLIEQHPEAEITFVSRSFVKPLFSPLNINFFAADLKGKHRGVFGLFRLYKELNRQYSPDLVIDLHQVLRSAILNFFFKASGIKVFKINKGRSEKDALTRKSNKVLKQLKHSTTRYADVFNRAGLPVNFDTSDAISINFEAGELNHEVPTDKKNIGIAPLAFHKGKSWPLSKMKALIQSLVSDGHQIFLFGGPNEKEILEGLKENQSQVTNLAGQYNLSSEIYLMSKLDLMIAMDSSNMHLATLAGVPVISIWGATHSYAGFGPLSDNDHLKVEIGSEQLDCRPCSVFGNKECFRGDYACLESISPEMVKLKVDKVLMNKEG